MAASLVDDRDDPLVAFGQDHDVAWLGEFGSRCELVRVNEARLPRCSSSSELGGADDGDAIRLKILGANPCTRSQADYVVGYQISDAPLLIAGLACLDLKRNVLDGQKLRLRSSQYFSRALEFLKERLTLLQCGDPSGRNDGGVGGKQVEHWHGSGQAGD
jgi:hypothetical protein